MMGIYYRPCRRTLKVKGAQLLCLVGIGMLWASLLSAAIIPVERRITWTGTAGVTGDIPTTRTNCATAACNDLLAFTSGTFTTYLQAAIDSASAGEVIRMPAGTFDIGGPVVPKPNTTLRGAGMGTTILHVVTGYGGSDVFGDGGIGGSSYYLQTGTSVGLVNPVKGDTTLETASAHGWSVNDYIQIDMLIDATPSAGNPRVDNTLGEGGSSESCRDPGAACRPFGQTVQVVSIPDTTHAVIDVPLYWTYNKTPQAVKIVTTRPGLGFEDFTIDATDTGNATGIHLMHLGQAFESWVYRVEFANVPKFSIFAYGTHRVTIRQCLFRNATTNDPYAIVLWNRNSRNLIEDNIFVDISNYVQAEGSTSGNVIAYNYATAPFYDTATAGTGFGTHAAHPAFNLYEGNQIEGRYRADMTHGSNSHATLFRNRIINDTNASYTSIRNLVDLWGYSSYNNIVGNILGGTTPPGNETIYEEISGPVNASALVVYSFGEGASFNNRGEDGGMAHDTVFRQGNWDAVGGAIRWDEDIVNSDHTLPDSLYLAVKPSWYGTCIWPPFDPTTTPLTLHDIPAKVRYEGNSCGMLLSVPPHLSGMFLGR